jgi:hypothetical protein
MEVEEQKIPYEGLKKIDDDLYVGKVADDFYLAMERVDSNNLDMWLEYAKKQVSWVDEARNKGLRLKYLPSSYGSNGFKDVIEGYKKGTINPDYNELWVAYVSNIPISEKANLADENPHIEMFVTVITSPHAVITSHMGISRTWEAALDLEQETPLRKKHPDQSIHLHSFAAKIMKMRYPCKVYMLTTPLKVMREILVKKMPANSVFIGDNTYKVNIKNFERREGEVGGSVIFRRGDRRRAGRKNKRS